MHCFRQFGTGLLAILLLALLAACSSTPSSTRSVSTGRPPATAVTPRTAKPTSAPQESVLSPQVASQENGQPSPSSTQPILLGTASVMVGGKQATVLTSPTGLTLYTRTSTAPPCIAACLRTWKPLLTAGPVINPGVTGSVALLSTPAGKQVTFNDQPLYTYVGDTARGQVNGVGKDPLWHPQTVLLRKGHW